ncbi:MAG: DMT family transporter [Chitinophagaceae bacterium]|nr:DMT family transporter [Chitinophagaceae bacterium]
MSNGKLIAGKAGHWFLVVLVNFMWATQVPVIRMIGDRLGPMTIAFVPMIISTVLFIPFLLIENRKRQVTIRRSWKDLKYFIVPGLIGIFLMQYLYTIGSTMTLAANAGIITLTIPVVVAVFASVLLKEKLNAVRVAAFVIAIAGVLLTSLPDIKGASFSEGRYFWGNIIFSLACCCCAFYNTYCKLLVEKGFTELEILVYCSVVGCIAAAPFLIWVEPLDLGKIIRSGSGVLLGMLELSLIVYGISMLLFFYVLKWMDVTQAILGTYLLPFLIALLGVMLLHEKITVLMLGGGGIIIAGTLMVTVYEKQLLSLLKGLFSGRKKQRRQME